MNHGETLYDILVLLLAAVAVVPVLKRLGLPPVLGYLAAGIVLGPYTPGPVVDSETTRPLAEFGVVFLLFAIGLELPLARLKAMRRHILGLGLVQVALTGAVLGGLAWGLGLTPSTAFLVGVTLSFSSTAMVVALLVERGETVSHYGRMAVAVLIFQDLAVIPVMTLLPLLSGGGHGLLPAMGLAAFKAVGAVALILVVGRLVLRPVLGFVAASRSPEMFTAATLLIVLAVSWLTHLAGMSLALGAFLAGLMLAGSPYRHQVEADIEPFRGLLLGLFFMTVGMSINLPFVGTHGLSILVLSLGLMAVKVLVLLAICRVMAIAWDQALRVGFLLAQTGEFAFVVFDQAMTSRLLDGKTGQMLLAATVLSMVLTPLLAKAGRALARTPADAMGAPPPPAEAGHLEGHVVLCGYGRMGRAIARLMDRHHVPFIAMEHDAERVMEARKAGLPVYFGDATQPGLLRSVGIGAARAVVVTVGTTRQAERTIAAIRHEAPNVPLVARAKDRRHEDELIRMGASVVVPETVEASLQMAGQALKAAGIEDEATRLSLEAYRDSRYGRRQTD